MTGISFRLVKEDDLKKKYAKKGLWDLNSQQTDFISMITHQLRTPLSGVKWTLDMLMNDEAGPTTPEQHKWLREAFISNEEVIRLVDEILTAFRLDSDGLKMYPSETDVVAMLNEVLKHVTLIAERKQIEIEFKAKDKDLGDISIDPERIGIAFRNIVENAIRYTSRGGKIVIDTIREEGDIKISIKDNGIGIKKEDRANMFKRFFRAQNAFRVHKDGTGLGLFIAKSIIERHGGQIWFESEEGKGTTFYFILPLHYLTK